MAMLVSGITACAEETYTTKTGDDLSKIAKMIYGDALKWREIYERNKEQIKDPNVIYANQTLIIPDTATAQVNTDTTAQEDENTVTVDTSEASDANITDQNGNSDNEENGTISYINDDITIIPPGSELRDYDTYSIPADSDGYILDDGLLPDIASGAVTLDENAEKSEDAEVYAAWILGSDANYELAASLSSTDIVYLLKDKYPGLETNYWKTYTNYAMGEVGDPFGTVTTDFIYGILLMSPNSNYGCGSGTSYKTMAKSYFSDGAIQGVICGAYIMHDTGVLNDEYYQAIMNVAAEQYDDREADAKWILGLMSNEEYKQYYESLGYDMSNWKP